MMVSGKGDREREDFFVSVVIPVFNEEQTIGDIVTRTKRTMEQMRVLYEVLVVDDGSEDRSAEISQAKEAQVIRETHQGKGYALRSGFRRAKGELVVTLDSDGSHKPEEIPSVVRCIRQDRADFVIGTRFFNAVNKTKVPRVNRIGNKLFNNLIAFLTGVKISDSQSGFRAIKSSLIKRMKLRSRGYEVESEMLVKSLRMGAKVVEIPISFDQRTIGGSRLDPIRDGIRILYAVIVSYLS
jgi:glycosyltransferase involved in cell wall biosynthesis